MTRVQNAVATKKRHKKVLKKAKGYFGNKSRLYRYAKEAATMATTGPLVAKRMTFSHPDR